MNRVDISSIQDVHSNKECNMSWNNNHIAKHIFIGDVFEIRCTKMHYVATRIINIACYVCRKHLSSHWHFGTLKRWSSTDQKRLLKQCFFFIFLFYTWNSFPANNILDNSTLNYLLIIREVITLPGHKYNRWYMIPIHVNCCWNV